MGLKLLSWCSSAKVEVDDTQGCTEPRRKQSKFNLMEHEEHQNRASVLGGAALFWHRSLGSEEQLGHRFSSIGTAGLHAPPQEARTTDQPGEGAGTQLHREALAKVTA